MFKFIITIMISSISIAVHACSFTNKIATTKEDSIQHKKMYAEYIAKRVKMATSIFKVKIIELDKLVDPRNENRQTGLLMTLKVTEGNGKHLGQKLLVFNSFHSCGSNFSSSKEETYIALYQENRIFALLGKEEAADYPVPAWEWLYDFNGTVIYYPKRHN